MLSRHFIACTILFNGFLAFVSMAVANAPVSKTKQSSIALSEQEARDGEALRRAFGRIIFGPMIASSTDRIAKVTAPVDPPPRLAELKPDPETADQVYLQAEVTKQMFELVAQAFGQAFKIRREGSGRTGIYRGMQESILRSALDEYGFFVPRLSRHIRSQSASYILVIWVSGTEGDGVPDVLVHPILGSERAKYKANPNEFVLGWVRRARAKLRSIPNLPRPGRWDFRPIVFDPDSDWAIQFPRQMTANTKYSVSELPKMLWLIETSASAVDDGKGEVPASHQ